jgi:hypothetical protein
MADLVNSRKAPITDKGWVELQGSSRRQRRGESNIMQEHERAGEAVLGAASYNDDRETRTR